MFKTRVIGLFVLMALAFVVIALWLLGSAEKSAVKTFERRVALANPAVVRAHKIREAEQVLVARAVAESELGVALELLDELGPRIAAHGKQTEVPPPAKVSRGRRDGPPPQSLPDMFVDRYVAKLKARFGDSFFHERKIKEFKKKEKQRISECAAIAVTQCYWDYTYNTLPDVLWEVFQRRNFPVESRVLITDARGTGLADSKRPKWSAVKGFAQSAELPGLAVKNGGAKRGVVLLDNRMFFATAVSIAYRGVSVGAVMVADPIDDKMAREDSDIVGADVTYAKDTEVIASSLDKNLASDLVKNPEGIRERVTAHFQAFPVPGGTGDLKVFVSADMREMLSGFRTSWNTLAVLAVFLLLLGVGLLLVLLRGFYRTFETLEQGIHEVINGNLEYQFPFDFKEGISRGLGQSMNLMSLVLQGRPLPEEVEEEANMAWTNELQVFEPVPPGEKGEEPGAMEPSAEGVDAAVLGEEPADVYYKRVYQEFVDARTTLGLSVEGINYPKFMERLVHLEHGLKKKHRCAMVRFLVSSKENEVMLIPVPINR